MDRIEAAAALLEEGAFSPETITVTLADVGNRTGLGHLALYKLDPQDPQFIAHGELAEIFSDFVDGGWHQIDVRTEYCARAKMGQIIRDHLMVPERVRKSSPLYNEFYANRDIGWMAGWKVLLGAEPWGFSLSRSRGGEFTDADVRDIGRLAPAANRAVTTALALRNMRATGMMDGLAAANTAAVLLDSTGHVRSVTPAAERLFDHDFGVKNGRLTTSDTRGAVGLTKIAAQAGGKGMLSSADLRTVAIYRQGKTRPIIATPIAVRGVGLDMLPGARVLILLIDLDTNTGDASVSLQRFFGLTPAEAAVAQLLAVGCTTEEISAERGVSRETVRSQIKAVQNKLDVTRQSGVVRLVERLARNHPSHGGDEG
jgi:DNA-binding CsgD family transcriptional regulator